MPKAVIEDWKQFEAYLATQPLCQWSAKKQQEMASGIRDERGRPTIQSQPPKDDNAALVAALSSMA